MDHTVYTPGAEHSPPVLAGRDELLRGWRLMLNDAAATGRVRAQDIVLVGPRGVGKTVTATAFGDVARQQGFEVVNVQAVSGHASLVDALLHHARRQIDDEAGAWQRAKHAFDWLGGFNLSLAGIGAAVHLRGASQGRRDAPRSPVRHSIGPADARATRRALRDCRAGAPRRRQLGTRC